MILVLFFKGLSLNVLYLYRLLFGFIVFMNIYLLMFIFVWVVIFLYEVKMGKMLKIINKVVNVCLIKLIFFFLIMFLVRFIYSNSINIWFKFLIVDK